MAEALDFNYLVDSHCHLNYKGLGDDLESLLEACDARNVRYLLAINARLREFDEVLAIAQKSDRIACSVGVHPHEAENEPDVKIDDLIERAKHPKVVAIGETGLDYYYDTAPRDLQKSNFRTHIHAARETGLPLIVHSRDAEDDTYNIMREEMEQGAFKGVIHCFTASQDFAEKALSLGFYIS
ncbi:MAG: TatD family hydrolase, partial [Sphingomonadales bacterium]|nr:TatD family hydrolase [Sphingomonadales bacterium]